MLYVNQRQNSKNKISRLEADENSTPELTRSVTIAIVSSKKQKGGDKTNKRKMLIAVIGVIAVSITITSASSLMGSTPLYTVRMEQVSHKMNFLPTEMNGFTYTTERGCTVNYNATKYTVGAIPLMTTPYDTYCDTCEPETCELETCEEPTCPWTCWETCANTCPVTCFTCATCPYTVCTCVVSCGGSCEITCKNTCIGTETCGPQCPPDP